MSWYMPSGVGRESVWVSALCDTELFGDHRDKAPHSPESDSSTLYLYRRVSSVVEHSYANPKVPGSIPGPVSYRGHGL